MTALAAGAIFNEADKSTLFEFQSITKDALFNAILKQYYLEDQPEVVWQQLIQRTEAV